MDIQLIALFFAPFTAISALVYGVILSAKVLKVDEGNDKLKQIAKAVREGAMSYLKRQFKIILPIMLGLAVVIALVPSMGVRVAVTFLMGAIFSTLIGYFGMWIANRANGRIGNSAELD